MRFTSPSFQLSVTCSQDKDNIHSLIAKLGKLHTYKRKQSLNPKTFRHVISEEDLQQQDKVSLGLVLYSSWFCLSFLNNNLAVTRGMDSSLGHSTICSFLGKIRIGGFSSLKTEKVLDTDLEKTTSVFQNAQINRYLCTVLVST